MPSYHHSLRVLLIAALASIFLTYIHLIPHIRKSFHPEPSIPLRPTTPTLSRIIMIPDARILTQTYYTTPKGHEVLLDVVIPPTLLANPRENVQIVVAFHGGGLIRGCRRENYIFQPILDAVTNKGYILISADHRLFYPSSGHDVFTDVSALFSYLSSTTFTSSLPDGISPDIHSIAVIGFSAGGYLVRLAGIEGAKESNNENPRFTIKTCISYFGMGGDVLLDRWVSGTTQAEKDRLTPLVKDMVGAKDLAEESDRPYTSTLKGYDQSQRTQYIWEYWTATGTLIDIITSHDGEGHSLGVLAYNDRLASLPTKYADVLPQLWLSTSENAKSFPPTLLIHGTADDAVPYEESTNTLSQLKTLGVDVKLVTVQGADHNLNKAGTSEEAEGTKGAHEKAVEWLVSALE